MQMRRTLMMMTKDDQSRRRFGGRGKLVRQFKCVSLGLLSVEAGGRCQALDRFYRRSVLDELMPQRTNVQMVAWEITIASDQSLEADDRKNELTFVVLLCVG